MILPDWVKENTKFPDWIINHFDLRFVDILETPEGYIVISDNGSTITRKEGDDVVSYHGCYPVGYKPSVEPTENIIEEIGYDFQSAEV